MIRWIAILTMGFLTGVSGWPQEGDADRVVIAPDPAGAAAAPALNRTIARKWHFFASETFAPMTLAGGAFNGAIAQATNSDPRYGVGAGPFAERFGASTADIVTQNFFGDFVMASVFHEDVRYRRHGPAYGGVWKRAGYAISRAFITKADTGGNTFNWSNLTGTAMSAGFSNLYYPPGSRSGRVTAIHFGTGVIGAGLANLFPEFWPDFRQSLARHHLFPAAR